MDEHAVMHDFQSLNDLQPDSYDRFQFKLPFVLHEQSFQVYVILGHYDVVKVPIFENPVCQHLWK